MLTRETEQAEGVPGGRHPSLAEDRVSLWVGCMGGRCGATGWAWPYPWWSWEEARWSLLLFVDLLSGIHRTQDLCSWSWLRAFPAKGKPPHGDGLRLGMAGAVAQAGTKHPASAGSNSLGPGMGPSCSIPVALPGGLSPQTPVGKGHPQLHWLCVVPKPGQPDLLVRGCSQGLYKMGTVGLAVFTAGLHNHNAF